MKKIFFFLFFFCPLHVMAQLFYSPNQQIVESAIRNGIFILSQDYQLKDCNTNEYFGRNGQEEFGRIFSLGVKVENGYCYFDQIQRPWLYDSNFERYRDSHIPEVYRTRFKEFTDSLMTDFTSFSQKRSVELYPETIYYMPDSVSFKGKGLKADSTIGNKLGWIVWVIANKAIAETDQVDSLSYVIYRKELEVKEDIREYTISAPNTNHTVLGGIFVEPIQSEIGQLTFNIIGIILSKEGKWNILTPFKKSDFSSNISQNADVDELTPILKEGGDGQDEVYDDDRTNKKIDKKRKK